MPATATSVNGVVVRLTEERWLHITEGHPEMAGYFSEVLEAVESPAAVFAGAGGELLAVREIKSGKHLVVVYREQVPDDGFVVTAFLTSRPGQVARREKRWPR